MNIVHMNEGEKIDHALEGCLLSLGLGELEVDLEAMQADTEQVLTVRVDAGGRISPDGQAYAAVVIVPPRRYLDQEITEEVDGETVTYSAPVAQPCDPGAVTLQLWAVPRASATTEDEE